MSLSPFLGDSFGKWMDGTVNWYCSYRISGTNTHRVEIWRERGLLRFRSPDSTPQCGGQCPPISVSASAIDQVCRASSGVELSKSELLDMKSRMLPLLTMAGASYPEVELWTCGENEISNPDAYRLASAR